MALSLRRRAIERDTRMKKNLLFYCYQCEYLIEAKKANNLYRLKGELFHFEKKKT